MELDNLKTTWKTVKNPDFSAKEIHLNISEGNHPVLKDIKKQFIIEIIGWSIFLSCFYSIFDGHQKPIWINVLLVSSIIFPIAHNLINYQIAKYLVHGDNLKESLKNYIKKVKNFAITSIVLRQFYLGCLLLFFCFGLTFNAERQLVFTIIVFVFLIQLLIICKIWITRIKRLKNSLLTFEG